MRLWVIINLLAITLVVQCTLFDATLIDQLKTSNFLCLISKGIFRIGLGLGIFESSIDEQSLQQITNALNTGLTVDIIIPIYTKIPAKTQIDLIKNNLQILYINKVWLRVASGITTGSEEACRFLSEYGEGLRNLGLEVGIWADEWTWIQIFKDRYACPQLSKFPLWWYPDDPQLNEQPNFDLYKQFGGWKVPYMKVIGFGGPCGIVAVYRNYYA